MMSRNRIIMWALLALLLFTFIPWLGLTIFNTKGEPREAIVAVSILQSGNWVLPVSYGADIPYKPPFLAWCIAAVSLLTGSVSEFTSRLPSAIALVALAMATASFFGREERRLHIAVATAMVFVTAFEVWRAGTACRVDMVLTAFMVGAVFSLYSWVERGVHGVPWLAVLLMSGAVLTKGPVGMVLPLASVWVYAMLRRVPWLRLTLWMALAGVLSCILPAAWYYAAYQQGGKEFLALMLEENLGRLTGTMSYDSHVNPAYYNVVTVVAGMLPYTLLALMAIAVVRWRRLRLPHPSTWLERLRSMRPDTLLALVTTLVIFVFYCIPKSKRSVYLLPIYPFLAYFVVLLCVYLWQRKALLLRVYGRLMSWLALIVGALLCVAWAVPLKGKSQAYVEALSTIISSPLAWALIIVTIAVAVMTLRRVSKAHDWWSASLCFILPTFAIYWTLSVAVLPRVLAIKSDLPMAEYIEQKLPAGTPVYSYITEPMIRYYTANFYLDDRLRMFDGSAPSQGYVIVPQRDVEQFLTVYGPMFSIEEIESWPGATHRSCDLRQATHLYRYSRLLVH